MKLKFLGAARTVTGSQTLLKTEKSQILIDCGLYQGPKATRMLNWNRPEHFRHVDAILITHAHIDHCGLLPRWTHWGWEGPIYCTPTTADLLKIMLMDAAYLQEEDAKYANQSKHSKHDPALALYTEEDAKKALGLVKPIPFEQWTPIDANLNFRFLPAGHILGSSMVELKHRGTDSETTVAFSGDLGGHSDLLNPPQSLTNIQNLVIESTYGDRLIPHSGRDERLAEIVNKVLSRGGTLVVPAFALGRTQDLLFSLYQLMKEQKIPEVPVYLDSPMANRVTDIYLKHVMELSADEKQQHMREALSQDFFHKIESTQDSMRLCESVEPKIVISASGMLQGGRILHHLKCKLPGPQNGVLFVGYQGQETKGRLLREGIESLRIHHKEIPVKAEIFSIEGFSAHADQEQLTRWILDFQPLPERVFLNHGEVESLIALAKKLREEHGLKVIVPELNDEFDLAVLRR